MSSSPQRVRGVGWLSILILAAAPAWAQMSERGENRRRELPETFYPTKSMVRFFADRMSEGMSNQLKMDPQQAEMARTALEQKLTTWLEDNRDQVEPTLNGFINMWGQKEPPSTESVQKWAETALPVMESMQGMFVETGESMREFLTEEQNIMLDGNLAAFEVGAKFMNDRLNNWREGGFDPGTDWHKSEGFRKAEQERGQMVREEQEYVAAVARGENPQPPAHLQDPNDPNVQWTQDGDGGAVASTGGQVGGGGGVEGGYGTGEGQVAGGDPTGGQSDGGRRPNRGGGAVAAPAAPADEWQVYTDQFCAKYDLSPEQRQQAYRFLATAQQARDNWKARKGESMQRLEQLARTAKTDEGRVNAKQQLDEMKRPFQTQFEKLKEKLSKLPTREQMKKAASKEAPPTAAAPASGG